MFDPTKEREQIDQRRELRTDMAPGNDYLTNYPVGQLSAFLMADLNTYTNNLESSGVFGRNENGILRGRRKFKEKVNQVRDAISSGKASFENGQLIIDDDDSIKLRDDKMTQYAVGYLEKTLQNHPVQMNLPSMTFHDWLSIRSTGRRGASNRQIQDGLGFTSSDDNQKKELMDREFGMFRDYLNKFKDNEEFSRYYKQPYDFGMRNFDNLLDYVNAWSPSKFDTYKNNIDPFTYATAGYQLLDDIHRWKLQNEVPQFNNIQLGIPNAGNYSVLNGGGNGNKEEDKKEEVQPQTPAPQRWGMWNKDPLSISKADSIPANEFIDTVMNKVLNSDYINEVLGNEDPKWGKLVDEFVNLASRGATGEILTDPDRNKLLGLAKSLYTLTGLHDIGLVTRGNSVTYNPGGFKLDFNKLNTEQDYFNKVAAAFGGLGWDTNSNFSSAYSTFKNRHYVGTYNNSNIFALPVMTSNYTSAGDPGIKPMYVSVGYDGNTKKNFIKLFTQDEWQQIPGDIRVRGSNGPVAANIILQQNRVLGEQNPPFEDWSVVLN